MPEDERFARFQERAAQFLQVAADQIVPEARFEADLGVDSLDLVELLLATAKQFGVTVDDAKLDGVYTVQDAFDVVTGKP